MRSYWIRRGIYLLLILPLSCIIYKPTTQRIVTPKGAWVKIDNGYDEIFTFYDVTAFFAESAKVDLSSSTTEWTDRHREVLTLCLVPGNSTVLAVYGHYEAIPGAMDVSVESYLLIIMLDTLCVNDSIQLASDSIELYFRHLRLCSLVSIQMGYTTALEGYLFIDSLKDNRLSGTARFSGESFGYYHSTKISDENVESWVSGEIKFKAVKQEVNEGSMIIGRTLGPLKGKETED